MTSSIAIPKRKQPIRTHLVSPLSQNESATSSPLSLSNYHNLTFTGSSYASSTSPSSAGPSPTILSSKKLGKSRVSDRTAQRSNVTPRRPSLLGSSLSKSEYTVINLNSDGPPRLVTCVKSSQGFDWNQELFLPSYMDFDSSDLELRQDPVHDIVLTDEEAAAMLP